MATALDTVLFICDQAGLGARLTYRKMFGEYALFLDGTVVALVCDDQLFVKPTGAVREFLGAPELAPPYPGAKDYFLIQDELEDRPRLREVLLRTAGALPRRPPKRSPPSKAPKRRAPKR